MTWTRFVGWLLASTLLVGALLYAFILVLDPYQNVPFSPTLARAPVSTNQRFAYPALARSADFDSLIVGTSTSRLLDPQRLNSLTGARFVNLSMNSATAYEQARIHELFLRHHPQARYFVIGVDETWCNRKGVIDRYTFREFPEWMYDDKRWNDLIYMFNDKALENAVRMAELLAGQRQPKYRSDGYTDFTRDFGAYDPDRAARRLHGDDPHEYAAALVLARREHADWRYPLLPDLFALVERMPADARMALVFLPLHARYIAGIAANMSECKGRIAAALAGADNVAMLDYLYVSDLTRNDAHYWDPVHYTNAVARLLEADIALALAGREPLSRYARELGTGHQVLP